TSTRLTLATHPVPISLFTLLGLGTVALSSSPNGSSGQMPAYYDAKLFTINFKLMAPNADVELLRHNHSINTIYMSDNGLPNNQPFISVLDAIQGDGFNPLWQEVQIVFNDGFTPRQLTSDNDIAAAAASGQITLFPTTEV